MKSREGCFQMSFSALPGGGMVYDPSGMRGHARKHACPDCYFCQSCSEVRCRSCRPPRGMTEEKPLSLRDQILLYERVNGEDRNSE